MIPAETGYRHVREAFAETGVSRISEEKNAGKRLLLIPYSVDSRTDTLFITINSGLLVCTTSRKLVMNALAPNAADTDIRNAPGFSKILVSSGKNHDKLFVVFENLGKTAERILPEEKSSLAGRILKLGGSAGGDIFIREDGLSISGYIDSSGGSERLSKGRLNQLHFRLTGYSCLLHQCLRHGAGSAYIWRFRRKPVNLPAGWTHSWR